MGVPCEVVRLYDRGPKASMFSKHSESLLRILQAQANYRSQVRRLLACWINNSRAHIPS
eukprot:COSAG01_NODE_1551_length_9933_cov_19.737848_8_plen_59_part_00